MRRFAAFFLAAVLVANVSEANGLFGVASFSGTSRYAITEPVCGSSGCGSNSPVGNQTLTGKSTASCTIDPAKTNAVIVTVGQSLASNSSNGTYTPTNSTTALELNFYNGTCYQMKDPILGASLDTTGSSYQGQLADGLLNDAKYQVVYFVNVAIGGTSSAQWASACDMNNRLSVACARLNQAGMLGIANTKYMVLWEQGQADGAAGVTSAQYQANVISAQNSMTGAGCNFPWVIAVSTMSAGTVFPTIQGAQAALVDNVTRFAGPNVDTAVVVGNRYDGTHPAFSTGTGLHAGAYKTVIEALF